MTERIVSVYQLLPDFGSYLSDLENCLQGDRADWNKYRKNPVPFIVDLLLDFGRFEGMADDQAVAAANAAAKQWAGR